MSFVFLFDKCLDIPLLAFFMYNNTLCDMFIDKILSFVFLTSIAVAEAEDVY